MAPQPTLMFVPSGALPIACTSRPSRSNASRRDARVGAVRAVDRRSAGPSRSAPKRVDDVVEVALGRARSRSLDRARRLGAAARRAAPRSPPRPRRESLRPRASKNLTPLYSGGLCEAEMTTPRSSGGERDRRRRQHAAEHRGRRRPRRRRARARPRARARSRACRARRRPARRRSRASAARPSRSTSSGGQELADDAANPVGSEVPPSHGAAG